MAIAKKMRDRKAMDAEIRNALSGGLGEFEIFFTEHWKALTVAGLAVVAAIGIFFGVQSGLKASQEKALNVLSSAQTVTELEKALKEYGSQPAASFARIRLARIYMDSKKLKEAEAQYKLLESSGLPAALLVRVRMDRAYLLERAGDARGAAALLAACAVNPAAPAGLRAEASFGAGRIYAGLKQPKEARKHLENCIRMQNQLSMGGTQWVNFAQFMLREVK